MHAVTHAELFGGLIQLVFERATAGNDLVDMRIAGFGHGGHYGFVIF